MLMYSKLLQILLFLGSLQTSLAQDVVFNLPAPATNQSVPATNQSVPATTKFEPATNQSEIVTTYAEQGTNQSKPASSLAEPAASLGEPDTNLGEPAASLAEPDADGSGLPALDVPDHGSGDPPPNEADPSDLLELEPSLEANLKEEELIAPSELNVSSEVSPRPEPRSLDLDQSSPSPLPIVFPSSSSTLGQGSENITNSKEATTTKSQPEKSATITTNILLWNSSFEEGSGDLSNSTNQLDIVSDNVQLKQVDGGMDLQTQVYIICGVYGGILLLLIILVLAIALSLAKLRDQIGGEMERYVPADINPGHSNNHQIFAYENGAFNGVNEIERNNTGMRERSVDGDDDLERMGYAVYSGNKQNRYPSPSGTNSRQVMKYEEGVIPLEDRGNRYK